MTDVQADNPESLTVGRAEALIASSRPHGRGYWLLRRWGPITGIAGAVLLLWNIPESAGGWSLVPLAILAIVLGVSWYFGLTLRRRHSLQTRAAEAVQTRQWAHAQALLQQVLSRPIDSPEMRGSALLSLAEVAASRGRHAAAVTLCDSVLEIRTGEASARLAKIRKALSLLAEDRLTDANTLIDSLRAQQLPEPLGTLVELAVLYRQIRTGHVEDAVAAAPQLARRAREHLGHRAAMVYGLQASAHLAGGDRPSAERYYDCATRLMTPARLGEQLPDLASLDGQLEPARRPAWR